MEQNADRYIEEYVRLLQAIEMTDGQGNAMSFATGVNRIIELFRESTSQGSKIMFIGNGGSAVIASHFALDYWYAGAMRAVMFNDSSQLTCLITIMDINRSSLSRLGCLLIQAMYW